jgi:hypothetical protein
VITVTDKTDITTEWLELMQRRLPNEAEDRDWPIHLDHCFGRVIYDCVLGGKWDEIIDSPACEHLNETELQHCIDIGERIIEADDAYLRALNDLSLRHRGKL